MIELATAEPLVVLVVDDDPLLLMNTRAMLEDLGHTAIAADSGAQALEILNRATRIDLLVTDQVMPDMTGIQLAGIVRETWPQIPIIIANEYGEMPREAQGRYVTLSKPFFRHDLYKALCHTFP